MIPTMTTIFKFIVLLTSLVANVNVWAQPPKDPLHIVQAQLDAYNQQDVKAFAAVFSPEVLVYNKIGDTIPSILGRAALEKRYGDLFKQYPNNYSTLTGRMVQGNYVIDHEYVTGRGEPVAIVAIYEVTHGLITRCWFIR